MFNHHRHHLISTHYFTEYSIAPVITSFTYSSPLSSFLFVLFQKMFGAKLPGEEYFKRALNYYRAKFPNNVAFVAASDDMAFIQSKLKTEKDVFYAPGEILFLFVCFREWVVFGVFFLPQNCFPFSLSIIYYNTFFLVCRLMATTLFSRIVISYSD